MPEKTLRFWKQPYIPPEYKDQIEQWDKKQRIEKGKRIAGAMEVAGKGHLVKGLAQSLGVAQDIREEIKAGDTSSFPYLLGLAILIDLIDPVPVVGLIVKVVAKPILIYGTLFRGRLKYKYATKIIYWYWGITVVELVPGINWLPLETVSVLMLWRATAKIRREKEAEEEDNNQLIDAWGRKIKDHDRMGQRIQGEIANIEKEINPNQPQINKQAA